MSEEKCTCQDEFRTAACPVHNVEQYKPFESQKLIVDDKFIINPNPVNIISHRFACPACGQGSLITESKYCQACGVKIEIQSAIATAYIREKFGIN